MIKASVLITIAVSLNYIGCKSSATRTEQTRVKQTPVMSPGDCAGAGNAFNHHDQLYKIENRVTIDGEQYVRAIVSTGSNNTFRYNRYVMSDDAVPTGTFAYYVANGQKNYLLDECGAAVPFKVAGENGDQLVSKLSLTRVDEGLALTGDVDGTCMQMDNQENIFLGAYNTSDLTDCHRFYYTEYAMPIPVGLPMPDPNPDLPVPVGLPQFPEPAPPVPVGLPQNMNPGEGGAQ